MNEKKPPEYYSDLPNIFLRLSEKMARSNSITNLQPMKTKFIDIRWLYNISRGIDKEPVQVKLISKSIGCCKRFPGRTSLCEANEVEHWMRELSGEIADRLEEDLRENNRKGRLMTVSFSQETNQTEVSSTRAVPLKSYEMEKISTQALEVVNKFCRKSDGSYHITFLGLSIGNFENIKNVKTITSFFGKVSKTQQGSQGIENRSNNKAHTITNDIKSTTLLSKTDRLKAEIHPCKFPEHTLQSMDSELNSDKNKECDDKSTYSDSTVDLEENPDDYIFFPVDKHSENNISRFLKNTNVSNEITADYTLLQTAESSNSAFSSENRKSSNEYPNPGSPILGSIYRENINNENESPTKIERNFDTSKIFEGHYKSSDEEEGNDIFIDNQCNSVELSEKCKECGEIIPIVDIVSHMDYHLALKLSQEVFPSTAVVKEKQTNQSLDKKQHSKKRKVSDSMGNSIVTFLKKQDIDENSELCIKCNKRIKLIDIGMHSDYHAAKELHLELNSPSAKVPSDTVNSSTSSSSMTATSKQVGKMKKNTGNIASFFKQLDSSL